MKCLALILLALAPQEASPYGAWKNGPPTDPAFFPVAVWVQSPRHAAAYKAAGINTYVGLWKGPTAEQLDALKAAGLKAVCAQNAAGLARKDDPTIIAWMHGDEPDNAQPRKEGGYGPPIAPEKIIEDAKRMRAADPSRPVLLNLGQGVAWDNYIGRGVRRNRPEDYPEYLKGCDIGSFDIYPAVHDAPEIAGKLEFVARGVERLRAWGGESKIVWNCIEASRISNRAVKPTAGQIRAEVWMSLIHGSRGIIYFVHQFEPEFVEASLLRDPDLLKGVTAINAEIHALAPALNAPSFKEGVTVSSPAEAPVAWMAKRHGEATYLFAVGMRGRASRASVAIPGTTAEVLGEGRSIPIRDGRFEDDFAPYAVHLYKVR